MRNGVLLSVVVGPEGVKVGDEVLPIGEVTVLPQPGQRINLWGRGLFWIKPADLLEDATNVRVFLLESETMRTWPYMIPLTTARGLEPVGESLRIAYAAASIVLEKERWLDHLAEDARTFADDNNLCEVFDQFMEEHGMKGRTRDFRAEFTITFTAYVEGSTFDNATENLTKADVLELLNNEDWTGKQANIDQSNAGWGQPRAPSRNTTTTLPGSWW
ncbi:hypothetical protein [Tessaracoccus palaemonis]|uniref:Uncharacterized protein n=1 Tax=Tessaracoccus palaemonis TaxID=2829499 RepID=A0ABX8SGD7_9ACTN|nr:hypothetical protein [Tessaracoccus palaemonis]QXT62467.1 hypothetical protein KDB89_12045 [Tessaracoccus palaemonis]